MVDLYLSDTQGTTPKEGPATELNGTDFGDRLFTDRALGIISTHDDQGGDHPLFLYFAFQVISPACYYY